MSYERRSGASGELMGRVLGIVCGEERVHRQMNTHERFQSLAAFVNSLERITTTYEDFAFAVDSGDLWDRIDLRSASVAKVSCTGLKSPSSGIPRKIEMAEIALQSANDGMCYQ